VAEAGPLAVAIVNHNTRDHLRACLASVRAAGRAEVVVADSGSTDGSAGMVRHEFPEALLLADGGNPGYGAAANRAIAACSAPFVLLLNADTRLGPGTLQALASYLEGHPRAAVAGPRLLNLDGTLQASCFPFIGTFQLMLEKTALGRWLARVPAIRDRWLLSHSLHDRPRVVPWVVGAAMAIRREAFEAVGGFDPSFFMYSEEIDLCWRLKQAGWEVHFAPVATVLHFGGASTEQRRPEMAVRRVASSKLFYRRHYSRLRASALETMIGAAMLARMLRDSLRLTLAREPAARSRLAEDLSVWRGALRRPGINARADGGATPSSFAVVVVNHETRDLLRACLETVREEGPGEVVVVDNASGDGSAALVRGGFPAVRLVANAANPGYGAAANQGIAACQAPYVLLLNSDTRLRPGTLAALGRELDRHSRAAIVGPLLLNPDGARQPSCFPFLTPFAVLAMNTYLNRVVRHAPGLRQRFRPVYFPLPAGEVPWVKGAALAIRREAFDAVGGFDESYFLYAEEMDLCWRLRAAGWEVRFTPAAAVVHEEGASTGRLRPEMAVRLFASLAHFHRLHSSRGTLVRLRWAVTLAMLEHVVRDTVKSLWTRDPQRRRALGDDLVVWRRVLQEGPVR
jgi:hypothetical protein